MTKNASAVRVLLDAHVPRSKRLNEAFVATTAEMVAKAIIGEPTYGKLDLRADIRKAVASATGRRVADLSVHVPDERHTRVVHAVSYHNSLATFMREKHWSSLESGFARAYGNSWGGRKDEVWNALLADARPYNITAWTNADDPPTNTPGENLLTSLFYFVSFATLGDAGAMEPLANLVRLLPKAVPIGEWNRDRGNWVYVLRPAGR